MNYRRKIVIQAIKTQKRTNSSLKKVVQDNQQLSRVYEALNTTYTLNEDYELFLKVLDNLPGEVLINLVNLSGHELLAFIEEDL